MEIAASSVGLCFTIIRKVAFAVLACIFSLGGAIIGSTSGALKGQTTETGMLRGAGIGAVVGVVVSMEVLESCLQGELLSKVAIFDSLLNGKIFREWVSPAILKAYQWQINSLETSQGDTSDIFCITKTEGLLPQIVKGLPEFKIIYGNNIDPSGERTCAVCLQDFLNEENARKMPVCQHTFHVPCIDRWLLMHGSCPICRKEV